MANSGGTFTIEPSGPGVIASTVKTDSACTSTSLVTICASTFVEDGEGQFVPILTSVSGTNITISAARAQLSATLTGNYVLVNT